MKYNDFYKSVAIGSQVTLINSTNNFNKGDNVVVTGFIDNDPDKIIVEGIAPGGWIPSKKVKKELLPIRFMTPLEMMVHVENAREYIPHMVSHHLMRHVVKGDLLVKGNIVQGSIKQEKEQFTLRYCISDRVYILNSNILLPGHTPRLSTADFKIKFSRTINCSYDYEGDVSAGTANELKNIAFDKLEQNLEIAENFQKYLFEMLVATTRGYTVKIARKEASYNVHIIPQLRHADLYKGDEIISPAPINGDYPIGVNIHVAERNSFRNKEDELKPYSNFILKQPKI